MESAGQGQDKGQNLEQAAMASVRRAGDMVNKLADKVAGPVPQTANEKQASPECFADRMSMTLTDIDQMASEMYQRLQTVFDALRPIGLE